MPKGPFHIRVLIVDDEPVIRETLSAVLESDGFLVRTAEDGLLH